MPTSAAATSRTVNGSTADQPNIRIVVTGAMNSGAANSRSTTQ